MYLASSSATVKFHTFPDGKLVHNYQPGCEADNLVRDISWSRDGNWLALVPKTGHAEIISLKNHLKLIHTIEIITAPTCVSFQNTTKKFLAVGTRNGLTLIYDVKSRQVKNQFPRCNAQISHVDFTAKDSHLVSACSNGDILVYSCINFALSATFQIPKSSTVSALRTNSTKRNLVLAGSDEGVVVVWDTNVNKPKFFVESHQAPVTGVAFSPVNSDLIISSGSDRQFSCYDIVSNKCIATVPVNNNVTSLDFSPDGKHFVMSNFNGNVCLYDSRKIIEPVLVFEAHKNPVRKIAFQKLASDKSQISGSLDELENVVDCKQKPAKEVSFSCLLQNSDAGVGSGDEVTPMKQTLSVNEQDSFLLAMGMGKHSISDFSNNQSVSKRIDIPESEMKSIDLRKSLLQKQISTSTPNNPSRIDSREVNLAVDSSPILNEKGRDDAVEEKSTTPISMDKITEYIDQKFENFTREMSGKIDELHKQIETKTSDIRYNIYSYSSEITQLLYQIQFQSAIDVMNIKESLKNLTSSTPSSGNYRNLLEEITYLRAQLALQQEELLTKSCGETNSFH